MSVKNQNNDLTESQSQTEPEPLQTGYEFYNEKYTNFVAHICKVAGYNAGLKNWYHRLEGVEFSMFISIVAPEIENKTPREIIEKFAEDENFKIACIKEADLNKIERYIQLFQVMLED